MKTIFKFTQAIVVMMGITFAAKAETAKEILRNKIKSEALSLFNNKEYDKALYLYLSIANDELEKGKLDYMIGMCYMSTNDKHKALTYLVNAHASNQNTFVVNYYLGKAYYNAGDYHNALAYLTEYTNELSQIEGLVFKKVKNVPDAHKVHYEKSLTDVNKVIEICKSKINKTNTEASKANISEEVTYESNMEETQVSPTIK
jgi:tetratricopeptide (TPR) repeat protein